MPRVRDVKKLIECISTCLASINKVKNTALYIDNYRVETINILDEMEDVLVVGIKSFVKPMDEPSFELKIVIKNVLNRLTEDELECQKFIVDYIWKKYKITKFEMEDRALRQGIWSRLNNNNGTYTKLDAEIEDDFFKKYVYTDTILTKQEVDKTMQKQNQHKLKDITWKKYDELWSSD